MSDSILNKRIFPLDRLRPEDIEFFLSQMAIMLNNGRAPLEALEKFRFACENKKLLYLVDGIYQRVSEGDTLVEAFLAYEKNFSPIFIQLLRICKSKNLEFEKLFFDYQIEAKSIKILFNVGNRGMVSKLT